MHSLGRETEIVAGCLLVTRSNASSANGKLSMIGRSIIAKPTSARMPASSYACSAASTASRLTAPPSAMSSTTVVQPVRRLARPVTLAEMKADTALGAFQLIRQSRLSVVPVTDAEWAHILSLAA